MDGKILLLAGLFATVAFAGCVSDQDEGSVSVYVKDAPTDDFEEIHLVFTDVLVHYAGDSDAEDDNETDDGSEADDGEENGTMEPLDSEDSGDWITVFHNATGTDVDLLAASGDASAFLGEANLTTGKYTQIRIVVQAAYGIDGDGERHDFTVSSGTVKIPHPFDVEADQETKLTIDFDLDRSIHQQGQGDYRMTPVIGHTDSEVVEDDESGEDVDESGDIVEE